MDTAHGGGAARRVRSSSRSGCCTDVEGFASIDALVALTLLALTLSLSLAAVATARNGADRAAERQRAIGLMKAVAETAQAEAGARQGQAGDLAWSLKIEAMAPPEHVRLNLCRISVQAASLRGGRRYQLSTIRPCVMRRPA